MIKKSKITRFLIFSFALVGFVLISGSSAETNAQVRDPFVKPGWAKPKPVRTTTPPPASYNPNLDPNSNPGNPVVKPEKPKGPVIVDAPSIDERIAYYKMKREQAALNGLPIPKVTTVLTLNEMSVIGIFRTPRGYAAMVEAEPIKLSYTIYPGEKFFDGQLVAVEENRLVFRKVTKMSNNKFISSVENKTLRQYTVKEEVQGTAPIGSSGTVQSATNSEPAETEMKITPSKNEVIISPLEELNNQPQTEGTEDSAKKKPVKKAQTSDKKVKVAKGKKP